MKGLYHAGPYLAMTKAVSCSPLPGNDKSSIMQGLTWQWLKLYHAGPYLAMTRALSCSPLPGNDKGAITQGLTCR